MKHDLPGRKKSFTTSSNPTERRLNAISLLLLITCLLLSGCTTALPVAQERIPSAALKNPEQTELGGFFLDEIKAHPGKSGVALVPSGEWGFRTRAGLSNTAEKTIDVQYYIWELDTSGSVLVERLLRAADRGVRVRMMLDHFTTQNTDFKFVQMDQHPNVEIRLFNPFARDSFRMLEFLFSLERLNHRMHNKAFIVDNAIAIVGGRNIGDNYFEVHATTNSRDLDLAVTGPVVQEVSDSFDQYWNSDFAIPVSSIAKKKLSLEEFQQKKEKLYRAVEAVKGFPYPIDKTSETVMSTLEKLRSEFIWAPAEVLYDEPDKLETGEKEVFYKLIRLGEAKDHETIYEAAYVVPGIDGIEIARRNKDNGIRQRMLTNSLATNNIVAAHSGYAKYRRDLIKNGVELYELRPDTTTVSSNSSLTASQSTACLHTKALVIDRKFVVIGSFNLDPRSIALNTEIVILIESPELAKLALEYLDEGIQPEHSYQVTLETDPGTGTDRLVWITEIDDKEVRYYSDPEVSLWRRFKSWFIGLFPIEKHL